MIPHKPNTYLALHLSGLRNGSFYRKTKRKGEYAHYMNGDFIRFTHELPAGLDVVMPYAEAKAHLPACNRINV